ncbi:MAG TPA: hypothetical protein ENH13_04635 [Euryarchaeota archaeon]|nr:hypothetical protein [Euryarchaeota archaeon]
MKSDITEIVKANRNLSKSPLGIIALFLVLVYAMASLFTGLSDVSPIAQGVLVCFLVLFPLIVLAVFYNLVTKHQDKLYAPTDYRTDSSFLQALEFSLHRGSGRSTEDIIHETVVKLSNRHDAPAIKAELSKAVVRLSLLPYGYFTVKVLWYALQNRVEVVFNKKNGVAMTVFDGVQKGAYQMDYFFKEFLELHGRGIITIQSMEPFRFTVADFAKDAIEESYAELCEAAEERNRRDEV